MSLDRARPADRYGTPVSRGRTGADRRVLAALLGVFVVAVLAFAAWSSIERSRSGVTWIELGITAVDSRTATITFQVSLPPGRSAICTVRAVNDALTEVGRTDVVVGPVVGAAAGGQVRTTATIRTAEPATGGGVKACVSR